MGNIQGTYVLSLTATFLFPSLAGLLFGYDIGATSFALTQIQNNNYSGVHWGQIVQQNSFLKGVIASGAVGGALLGSIIVFPIADSLGRRKELIIGATLYALGAFLEYISGRNAWTAQVGISLLLVGRCVYGIGCGFSMHAAPAYIGEMAPPHLRGPMVSGKEAMIVLGILLGFVTGQICQHIVGGWTYIYAVSIPIAVIVLFAATFILPPSARWLVLRGRIPEARASLSWIMKKTVEREALLQDIILQVGGSEDTQMSKKTGCWHLFEHLFQPQFRKPLYVGFSLVMFQQITGQPSVLYYAETIFNDVGISSASTLAVGSVKLLATLFSAVTIEKYGRRPLLLSGISLMLLALLVLTAAFISFGSTFSKGVVIFAMLVYVGGYQIGFGPIVWLFIAEAFPLEVRGQAVAAAVLLNFFWNLIVTLLFQAEIDAIGPCLTFALFSGITVTSLWFVSSQVPETKGLSLEEIERMFMKDHQSKTSPDQQSLIDQDFKI